AALAAAAVWGPRLPARPLRRTLAATGRTVLVPLRRLHSGHLGDYVTWLVVGMAGLVVAVGLQTTLLTP
ncbi:hypothetical protein, partial [Streptomyces sp. ISL-11]|uniref:hypothetical protein n=1 Tax=Streptomyces sp. ISL-11 TaxID=2819174 RepID=UPI001BECD68A